VGIGIIIKKNLILILLNLLKIQLNPNPSIENYFKI
jgi:hypothetical protein